MSITGGIVIFVLAWWMSFYAFLPVGVRGQAEMKQITPGTEPGAPINPDLKRKAIWSSLVAAGFTLVFEVFAALGWLGSHFSTG